MDGWNTSFLLGWPISGAMLVSESVICGQIDIFFDVVGLFFGSCCFLSRGRVVQFNLYNWFVLAWVNHLYDTLHYFRICKIHICIHRRVCIYILHSGTQCTHLHSYLYIYILFDRYISEYSTTTIIAIYLHNRRHLGSDGSLAGRPIW